jgi:hypothetical protein
MFALCAVVQTGSRTIRSDKLKKRAGNTYLEDFQLFRLPNVCFGGVTSFAGDPANGVFDEPPSYRCANTTYFYKQTLLYYKDKLYLGHI